MWNEYKEDKTIKEYLLENVPFILGVGMAIINICIASIITPLKGDIGANARAIEELRIDQLQLIEKGSVHAQINTTKIDNLEKDIIEIKDGVNKIGDKMDRIIGYYD